jgi:hypothetical protein
LGGGVDGKLKWIGNIRALTFVADKV